VAVVQDGAATAARAGKPLCAAVVAVSAVRTDLGWVNCAKVAGVGEGSVGSARRSPTVEHHPVGDSVTAVARVVRAVEATPDFCGELSLLIGITGKVSLEFAKFDWTRHLSPPSPLPFQSPSRHHTPLAFRSPLVTVR
jgi:hypothetical protein